MPRLFQRSQEEWPHCAGGLAPVRRIGAAQRQRQSPFVDFASMSSLPADNLIHMQIYNPVTGIQRERLSAAEQELLDEEDAARAKQHQASLDEQQGNPFGDDPSPSGRYDQHMPSPNLNQNLSPTLRALYPNRDAWSPTGDEFGQMDDRQNGTAGQHSRRSLGSRLSHKPQPFIHRDAAITRTDLIASAELIYARYFLGGAEKEIYLPPALRIHSFPLSSSQLPSVQHPEYEQQSQTLARVPDMFYSQKQYIYRQMEQDSFPRFLRAKSFGNLTPLSAIIRLGMVPSITSLFFFGRQQTHST